MRVEVLHILQDRRLVRRDRVHIATVERRILHAPVLDAQHIPERRHVRQLLPEQDLLRLSRRLHRDGLPCESREIRDPAVRVHRHHLAAHHIRPRPLIPRLASAHRVASPDAVDLARRQQRVLLLPVDRRKHGLVAHPPERLVRDLDVDAGRVPVFIHIHERRVGVASDGDLGQCFGLRCRRSALTSRQHHAEQPQRQQHRGHSFHPVLLKFNGV